MTAKRILFLIIGFLPLSLLAQLTVAPIHNSSQKISTSNVRIKSLSPMQLPFWDDFASTVNSDTLWESKSTVWVNTGLSINPPTVFVATFDGLNENGVPYSPNANQSLDYGLTDSLVSRRIKMTEVPIVSRNSVFLSFFYQWGGNGEVPDQNDFLRLDFLNDLGIWETVLTLNSNDQQLPNQFYSHTIRINQVKYYHDNFQFRFQSSGRKSGRYDTWNIDYVYMNKGRNENDLLVGFPDRAPYLTMTALFGKYYAVPQSHFITNIATNTGFISFGVNNLSSIPQPMNYSAHATAKYFNSGTANEQTFTVALDNPILPTIEGFENREITFTTKPDLSPYISADSVFLTLQTTLVTGDSVNTGFEPIDFYLNDTIKHVYALKDYYGYDDGTAEYAIGLTQSGNQVAYRFVLKTNTQDTVNGVYIHYPYTSGTSATVVNVKVWDDKNGKPGQLLLEELVPVQRKNNNQFIQRSFIQSVIVKDTFYIGWEHPSSGRVQIGLDTRQDTGDQLYVNVTGTWVQNTLVKGNVMIRPRFGTGDIVTSLEEKIAPLSIYPNPNYGEFKIQGECTDIKVYSLTGQTIPCSIEPSGNEMFILIPEAHPGMYIVRYRRNNTFFTEKFIIRKN